MATRGATLKMVKEVTVVFDPFASGSGVAVAREFIRRISSPKLLQTNPKVKLTTEVKCDSSPASIKVVYVDKDVQSLNAKNTRFDNVYATFIKTCKAKEQT